MSNIEFESPATRIIKQFSGKEEQQFRIPTDLPDLTFLRALSVQGRLRYDRIQTAITDTLSITPTIGETRFFYQILFNLNNTASWTVTISNAGNIRAIFNLVTTAETQTVNFVYNNFDSLVGNGNSSFDILCTENSGGGTMNVSTFSWSENTSRIRDVTI